MSIYETERENQIDIRSRKGIVKELSVWNPLTEAYERVIPGSGGGGGELPYYLKTSEIDMDGVVINPNGIIIGDEVGNVVIDAPTVREDRATISAVETAVNNLDHHLKTADNKLSIKNVQASDIDGQGILVKDPGTDEVKIANVPWLNNDVIFMFRQNDATSTEEVGLDLEQGLYSRKFGTGTQDGIALKHGEIKLEKMAPAGVNYETTLGVSEFNDMIQLHRETSIVDNNLKVGTYGFKVENSIGNSSATLSNDGRLTLKTSGVSTSLVTTTLAKLNNISMTLSGSNASIFMSHGTTNRFTGLASSTSNVKMVGVNSAGEIYRFTPTAVTAPTATTKMMTYDTSSGVVAIADMTNIPVIQANKEQTWTAPNGNTLGVLVKPVIHPQNGATITGFNKAINDFGTGLQRVGDVLWIDLSVWNQSINLNETRGFIITSDAFNYALEPTWTCTYSWANVTVTPTNVNVSNTEPDTIKRCLYVGLKPTSGNSVVNGWVRIELTGISIGIPDDDLVTGTASPTTSTLP